jgi:hypothetical protein
MQLCARFRARALVTAAASLVLCLCGPAAVNAANAANAAAQFESPPSDDIFPVVAWRSTELPPLEHMRPTWVPIDAFSCPAEHPWLASLLLKPHESVPRGVDVDRGSSVIVRIDGDATVDPATGYVTGWGEGVNRAVNLHLSDPSHATVTASCTSNPDYAYTPALYPRP